MADKNSKVSTTKTASIKSCLDCGQLANLQFTCCKRCNQRVHTKCLGKGLTTTLGVYTCCLSPLPRRAKRKINSSEAPDKQAKKNKPLLNDDSSSSNQSNVSSNNKIIKKGKNGNKKPAASTTDSINTGTQESNSSEQTRDGVPIEHITNPADMTDAQFRTAVCNFIDYMKPIKNSVDHINSRLDVIENNTSANTQDIEEVRNLAVHNTENISEIAIKFDEFEQNFDIDTFQFELADRERRSKNLIIQKVPVFPNETFSTDLDFINDLIDKINDKLDINKIDKDNLITKRFRNSSNALPVLCVTLNKKYDVFSILKFSSMFKEYKFSSDRTKMQRDKLNELNKIVNNHNLNYPEDKVFIKYINGKPTIVKASDYKQRDPTVISPVQEN